LYQRLHYYAGNLVRFITIPFCENTIEPEEACTIFGASFGKSGWHHIIKTLAEYDQNTDIDYRETSLYFFLKNFTPTSICDLLDNGNGCSCRLPLFVYPWGTFKKNEFTTNKNPLQSRFCGPSDDAFIKLEFARIIKLYNAMKAGGYKPWKAYNGFIGGTMLKRNDGDRRFIVLQGNHRLAILSHLGIGGIRVRSVSGYLKEISEKDLGEMIQLNEVGDIENSSSIFSLFFSNDGNHIIDFINNNSSIVPTAS